MVKKEARHGAFPGASSMLVTGVGLEPGAPTFSLSAKNDTWVPSQTCDPFARMRG